MSYDPFAPPLGATKGCTCAACMFKHEVGSAKAVDTEAYHGTGALESLEFKVGYMMAALERLARSLRCEQEGDDEAR